MKLLLIPSLLLLGFFSLTSTSCDKPFGEEKETVYLSDSLKAYCDFQVGSYWVYQDSVSKELDSVFVYMRNHDISNNRYINKETERIVSFYNYNGDTVIKKLWFNLDDKFLFTSSNKELWGGFNFPIFIVKNSPVYDDNLHAALHKEYIPALDRSPATIILFIFIYSLHYIYF